LAALSGLTSLLKLADGPKIRGEICSSHMRKIDPTSHKHCASSPASSGGRTSAAATAEALAAAEEAAGEAAQETEEGERRRAEAGGGREASEAAGETEERYVRLDRFPSHVRHGGRGGRAAVGLPPPAVRRIRILAGLWCPSTRGSSDLDLGCGARQPAATVLNFSYPKPHLKPH